MAEATAEDRLLSTVARLAAAATRELGGAPGWPTPTTLQEARATGAAVTDALLAAVAAADGPASPELRRLLARADRTEERVRRTTDATRDRRRAAADGALAELRAHASTAELVAAVAPLAVRACQARRVALGRIRDGVWSPWLTATDDGDTDHRPGRRSPVALDDLPLEGRVVATGRAASGPRTADDDGRPVVTVVAPVTIDGAVLALLEARIAPALVDAGTVLQIERVAGAIGRAFELAAVRDRAAAQSRAADALREDLIGSVDPGAGSADELPTAEAGARPVTGAPAGAAGRSALTSALTPRQRETLELMTHGLSNAEIADRLVVGVPTVKSHVTAILRAAGALNRVEAIKRHLDEREAAADRPS